MYVCMYVCMYVWIDTLLEHTRGDLLLGGALNPKPQTPNPKPLTPNPKPYTPNPKPREEEGSGVLDEVSLPAPWAMLRRTAGL